MQHELKGCYFCSAPLIDVVLLQHTHVHEHNECCIKATLIVLTFKMKIINVVKYPDTGSDEIDGVPPLYSS